MESDGFHWIPLDSNGIVIDRIFSWLVSMESIGFQWIPLDSLDSTRFYWIP
jgi:hypothetical protein